MTPFGVEKLVWEYGERLGQVFFPTSLVDVQCKIDELDAWGRQEQYPFLVHVVLTDTSLYLAFTVGHDYSLLEFAYDVDRGPTAWHGPFYLDNPSGDSTEIIPIYYGGSYTEPDTTRMLPYHQVRSAVYYFIEHRQFPTGIVFVDDDNELYQFQCS